jgi:hypothetical protein
MPDRSSRNLEGVAILLGDGAGDLEAMKSFDTALKKPETVVESHSKWGACLQMRTADMYDFAGRTSGPPG